MFISIKFAFVQKMIFKDEEMKIDNCGNEEAPACPTEILDIVSVDIA